MPSALPPRPPFLFLLLFAGLAFLRADTALEPGALLPDVRLGVAKTSIYIGSVSLETDPLRHTGTAYQATYRARVFPYFFYNEEGVVAITFSPEQMTTLLRGERVPFTGSALTSAQESRLVEGFATPNGPQSSAGKIKVKIFVSKKIQLIFNTTYQLTPRSSPST